MHGDGDGGDGDVMKYVEWIESERKRIRGRRKNNCA